MKKLTDNDTTDSLNDDGDNFTELDELNFSNDKATPSFADLDPEFEKALNKALEQSIGKDSMSIPMPGDEPTDNDLAPEILIKEDGSRSSYERGTNKPADQNLTIVDKKDIGGGHGFDEAELARLKPLDGKPWDGTPEK